MNPNSSRRRAFLRWIAAIAGSATAPTMAASAQVAPTAAPPEWTHYAKGATATIASWLQAEDAVALRLRDYLDGTRPRKTEPSPPLALKVWISSDGTVERIVFKPFAHAETNADLHALIVGRGLAGPPPKDMLQPIRLLIQLNPKEQTGVPAVSGDRATIVPATSTH